MGLALRRQHRAQRFLGRGLADGTRDRDHLRCQARARGQRKIAQALEHIVDDQQRRIGRELCALRARDHRKRRAGLQRGVDEIMAVMHVALDREIRLARPDGPAVDGKAGDRFRQRAADGGAHRLAHRLRCPQWRRAHATLDESAEATAS